jgi:membrane-associated protein
VPLRKDCLARRSSRWFALLLGLAGARAVLALAALPLIPVLYANHFVVLVLMRPTKEILLAAGFFVREADVGLGSVVLACIPLAVLGVWHFYALGRLFGHLIESGRIPSWASRFLPPERVAQLHETIERRGAGIVFLGRIAVFPSTLIGVAAGASGLDARRFLLADLAGAVVSIGSMLSLGYGLGYAHDRAGPWVTAVGVVAVVALALLIGRQVRQTAGLGSRPRVEQTR